MGEKRSNGVIFSQTISKRWGFIAFSALAFALLILGVFNIVPRQQASHAAASSGDWLTYMNSNGRQGFNGVETVINATSAPNLKQHWMDKVGGNIFAQPVVANGMIYWGSLDGYEHATNLNGTQVWQQFLGVRTTCSPLSSLGVVSTARTSRASKVGFTKRRAARGELLHQGNRRTSGFARRLERRYPTRGIAKSAPATTLRPAPKTSRNLRRDDIGSGLVAGSGSCKAIKSLSQL